MLLSLHQERGIPRAENLSNICEHACPTEDGAREMCKRLDIALWSQQTCMDGEWQEPKEVWSVPHNFFRVLELLAKLVL